MNSLIPVRGKPVLRNIIPLLISVIASAVFVLFFSSNGTLFQDNVGTDVGIWCIIGRGILHGYIPYLDLYDHKGPLLFYIFSVAMAISEGKTGLFLIEVLFTSISVFTIFKMAKLLLNTIWSWATVIVYITWSYATIDCGLSNEVLSQPFCLVPFYFALRYYASGGKSANLPPLLCVLVGAGGGAIAMIRMNNAALLLGCAIVVLLLRWKEVSFSAMLTSFTQMLLGFAALTLPFVLYFWHCRASEYFLQGLIYHNIRYAACTSKDMFAFFKCIATVPIVIVLVFLLIREWKKGKTSHNVCQIVAISSVLSALALQMGPGYTHYFYLFGPTLALTFCYIVRASKSHSAYPDTNYRYLIPYMFIGMCIIACCVKATIHWFRTGDLGWNKLYDPQTLRVCQLVQKIPQKERGQVISWEIPPSQLARTQIIPCFRYFALQRAHSFHLHKIREEIKQKLTTDSPLYIIARENAIAEPLSSCLNKNYEELARAGEGDSSCILYKWKKD